jgi:hypothetical protein
MVLDDNNSGSAGEPGVAGTGIDAVCAQPAPASASGPALSEDRALALLRSGDLTAGALEKIAQNPALVKSRKIRLALLEHPRIPRHLSLSLLRNLFTFDLMSVALMPTVAAEIKIAAEESLIHRLEKLSVGEKLSLARRAPTRVVAARVMEGDGRIVNTALENPRLTEAMVVKSLSRHDSSEFLAHAIRRHPKWSNRPEIKHALARRAERLSQSNLSDQTIAGSDS